MLQPHTDHMNNKPYPVSVELPKHLPITLIGQQSILPRRYVLHKHSQLCSGCNTKHEWTNLYAFNELATRTGEGKIIQHLVPITSFDYNLPIEVVVLQPKPVPACHECIGPQTVAHLFDPRSTDEWQRTTLRKATEGSCNSVGTAATKPTKTIEDIL